MGALVSKWTTINIPVVVSRIKDDSGKVVVKTVQDVLDSILPGLFAFSTNSISSMDASKRYKSVAYYFRYFLNRYRRLLDRLLG